MAKAPSTTIRIDQRTHEHLQEISRERHKPIGQVVTDLVEQYQREQFWNELESSLERLKADPRAWQEYQEEIALWDTTAGDGLENEEPYDDEDLAADA